jgi:hypothetical protein
MGKELVKALTDNPIAKGIKWLRGENPGPVSNAAEKAGGVVQGVGKAILPAYP